MYSSLTNEKAISFEIAFFIMIYTNCVFQYGDLAIKHIDQAFI